MKKLLLIAALAAVAIGVSAEEYNFVKLWEHDATGFFSVTNDARQGFGMDGKFYINDKGAQAVYIVDKNGLANEMLPGGANCGITRDEAGNILVSTTGFPGVWGEDAGIKVINPKTLEEVDYTVPVEDIGLLGRCDFIGFAKGNFFEDGALYLTGGNTGTDPYTQGVAIFTVSGGDVDYNYCYNATVTPDVTGQTSTVINYYKDINGEEALLYAYRSGAPSILRPDGDNFTRTTVSLPNKGASNGVFPFNWNGKELYIYPTLPNYQNGFAIAGDKYETPMIEVASTLAANPNSFQANWLNAEAHNSYVDVYQYVPGANITMYRLAKKVYIMGEVGESGWAANEGIEMEYDAENNIYTATVEFDGRGESGENYFSFTTELANDNDDGGWAYIAPFRFGAVSEGDYWYDDIYDGQPLSLTYNNGQAFRIMKGEYNITVNLEDMTVTISRVATTTIGDVNNDGEIDITDVTLLIDAVLSGDFSTLNSEAANCNGDESIDVQDVTLLIDRVLNGVW